jgi:hypothetical protein
MKSFAACFFALSLAACSSSNGPLGSTGASGGSGSSTGAKSTGTTNTGTGTGAATGSASAGTTGSPLGTPCTWDANTGVDSCTDLGYECTAELDNGTTGTCILPQQYGTCDQDINMMVGCQDGGIPNNEAGGTGDLFCSPPDFGSAGIQLCIYSCNTTIDCPGYEQSCYPQLGPPGGCFNNQCGQDPTSGAFVGPFFGTCPVLDAGDGQCLAFNSSPNVIAFCFQNGTADSGQPCNPQFRFGEFSECSYGNYCFPTPSGDGGLCFPITVDGGTCAAGDDVVLAQTGADWAVCAMDCTTSMSCDGGPVGTSCQTPTGSTASFCLP